MAVEDLLAGEANLDRPVEEQGGLGHHHLVVEGIALAAETAAVGRRDDADVSRRDLQNLGQGAVKLIDV